MKRAVTTQEHRNRLKAAGIGPFEPSFNDRLGRAFWVAEWIDDLEFGFQRRRAWKIKGKTVHFLAQPEHSLAA